MKWFLRSIRLLALVPLLAILGVSCTTTTNTYVTNSLAPTITGFSPDTVWTFQPLTIYGTNFGYDPRDVRVTIDTASAAYVETDGDTVITVPAPEGARTGFIHVWAYEQTATSAKPVVVEYTFYPHSISDTLPVGSSFSIPGTGMDHSHGILQLFVNGIAYPIDSVLPDRIVSHVIPNGVSGIVTMTDSSETYNVGSLTVTRPSAWNTLSEIWDNLTVTETHQRVGYINGPANPIDSVWHTTVTYSGQHDWNISGTQFDRTARGLNYIVYPIRQAASYLLFQIIWDTVSQTATVEYQQYSSIPTTQTLTLDTQWYAAGQSQAAVPVDGDIEFMLKGYGYRISEDSTDTQGLVNWQETITAGVTAGGFDLIFKR